MKNQAIAFLFLVILGVNCKETTTGPCTETNFLINSTFEINGIPSLYGWGVSDTSGMEFSSDIPDAGRGRSIVLHPSWLPAPPLGGVYQTIPAPTGKHRYLISVFGKMIGTGGVVATSLNRPTSLAGGWPSGVEITDTAWTYYSRVDTISAVVGDTIFAIVSGGACEACYIGASTYFNTCKFEKLD